MTIRERLAALGHERQRSAAWCAVNSGLIHELLDMALEQEEQLNRMLERELGEAPEHDWQELKPTLFVCSQCGDKTPRPHQESSCR